MRVAVAICAFACALALGSGLVVAPPPGAPQERDFTLVAQTGGYNGTAPGPLLDVNVGDTVVVTLVDQVDRPVSFHVHGMVIPSAMDGVPAHAGTQLIDSTAPPGGSFRYQFVAANPGVWHYHDHAIMGQEAAGGYYGTIVVRSAYEPRPATALDLHLLDAWNGTSDCPTLPATASARLEIDATALGNDVWTFQAGSDAPHQLGPGTSARFAVSTPGTYAWTATALYAGTTCQGSVVVS